VTSYCGLCYLTNQPNARPEGETIEQFRAHRDSHGIELMETALLVRRANDIGRVLGLNEGPSGCWCTCHKGKGHVARQTCGLMTETDGTCKTCGRSGRERYLPLTQAVPA
jgi:hypothetical protein